MVYSTYNTCQVLSNNSKVMCENFNQMEHLSDLCYIFTFWDPDWPVKIMPIINGSLCIRLDIS